MCLKEAPINIAVLQDSHRDVKMFLDRKVKTVKTNNQTTKKLPHATPQTLKLWE